MLNMYCVTSIILLACIRSELGMMVEKCLSWDMSGLEIGLGEEDLESVELVDSSSLPDLVENSLLICSSRRPFCASSMAFW